MHRTCLYVEPANALVDAVVDALSTLDFSLTHVTAEAVSDALTSTWTSILLLKYWLDIDQSDWSDLCFWNGKMRVESTYPVMLPERAVVDSRFALDCANENALLCDDAPKWLPLTTLKLTSPMLVAPIRDTASTLAASWFREILSSSSKSNLKPSRVVDTAQPARHNDTGTTPYT